MDKQCVRCGRAGHDSDECPWPLVNPTPHSDAVAIEKQKTKQVALLALFGLGLIAGLAPSPEK